MQTIRIGLIGTGYMGKAHAIALRAMPTVFAPPVNVVCELLAEVNDDLAREKARALGFNRSTGDWRRLVEDPDVDVVDICSPNFLHKEMALAAIAAGKHIYCEKPLSLSTADSLEMTEAAEKAGIKTLVGFNYMRNPAAGLAREIIGNGEIGRIVHFRGTHIEDYMRDPGLPFTWRLQKRFSGTGSLGDLCHVINMAHYLVGEIDEVCGQLQTVIPQRPIPDRPGAMGAVENDDQAHFMARFKNGAIGTLETSRIATGRKNALTYEINGLQGSITFDQERLSELKLYTADGPAGRQGFRTLLLGPEHPDYRHFSPAAGHGLGYNDMKIVEVHALIDGIAHDRPLWPDFRAGYEVDRVIAAVERSHAEGRWVRVADIS
ncbi:MAG: Gfo/Idh/MocA family oxidoreductase [Pseudomonadota bacterium]|nr:Gfo/Idh/MocA family oxidoreductase [Pseudomonadota bacterium]